jgi:carboxylesterase type B
MYDIAVDYVFDGVEVNDSQQVWNRYVQLVGDIIFVCPDYVFINEFSASGRVVYYYRFKPRPSSSARSQWTNAIHSDEIGFVFGVPLIKNNDYTFEEKELSKTMMKVWTKFAKYGLVLF